MPSQFQRLTILKNIPIDLRGLVTHAQTAQMLKNFWRINKFSRKRDGHRPAFSIHSKAENVEK